MADNADIRNGEDRKRINVNQDYEVRDWAQKFDVTEDQLKDAVQAVGDRADDVEMHLKGSRATTQAEQMKDAGK